MEQFKTYLTTKELADILDVEPRTVRRWANSKDSGYSRPLPTVQSVPTDHRRAEISRVKHGLYYKLAEAYVWITYMSKHSYKTWQKHRKKLHKYAACHEDMLSSACFWYDVEQLKPNYGLKRTSWSKKLLEASNDNNK